jgi:hypothetical protein
MSAGLSAAPAWRRPQTRTSRSTLTISGRLVSHDIRFAKWRKERTIGQHVWLRCPEPDAADVVKVWLDRIVIDLSHMPGVVLTVGPNSYNIDVGRWPKT